MKHRRRNRIRYLLMTTTMLPAILALALPSQPVNAFVQADCYQCIRDCADDAWWEMQQCLKSGGTTTDCNAVRNNAYNACRAFICNYGLGCDLPRVDDY